MPLVCGVKFRGTGKVYFFAPGPLEEIEIGESVIVETARGKEIGEIRQGIHEIDESEIVGTLKEVVRKATSHDLLITERYRLREAEALERCDQEIIKSSLDMKVVDAEYSFDGSRLTFFFTSDHRVDFRQLVRDLARVFRTRIELRQIGVRDQAKMIGGIGKCGRELCCSTWMHEFCPVSIRMAKTQNLPLTPLEISGLCGRLLCCLNYENEVYREVRSRFPKVGKYIETSIGPARVIGLNIVKELAEIELEDGTRLRVTEAQLNGEEDIQIPEGPGAVSAVRKALNYAESEREDLDEDEFSGDENLVRSSEETRRNAGHRRRPSSNTRSDGGNAQPLREQRPSSSVKPDHHTNDETKKNLSRSPRRRKTSNRNNAPRRVQKDDTATD